MNLVKIRQITGEYAVYSFILEMFTLIVKYNLGNVHNTNESDSVIKIINEFISELADIKGSIDDTKKKKLQNIIRAIVQGILKVFPKSENTSVLLVYPCFFSKLVQDDIDHYIENLILEQFEKANGDLRSRLSSRKISSDYAITRKLDKLNIDSIVGQHRFTEFAQFDSLENQTTQLLDEIEGELTSCVEGVQNGHGGTAQTDSHILYLQYYRATIKGYDALYKGEYFDSLKYFNYATELRPSDLMGWMNKGAILHDLGEYNEAIRCFDKAVTSNYWISYYYRACSYIRKGDIDNGLADIEEAIKANKLDVSTLGKKEKNFENAREDKRFQALFNS